MKIINAGYQIINEPSITKKIERIARVCYKSEDKISEDTDLKMIKALINREHYAMLEHGDICMEVSELAYDLMDDAIHVIEHNVAEINGTCHIPKKIFLRRTVTTLKDNSTRCIISGNIRAWYEFFLEAAAIGALPVGMYTIVNEQLGYILDSTKLASMDIGIDFDFWHIDQSAMYYKLIEDMSILTSTERMVHETISVLFTVDRGVTHEMVRMRDCSFAQESTRYCNYNLGKFGNEITIIKPCFWEEDSEAYKSWMCGCQLSENEYIFMTRDLKIPAQQARDVLPTSVKAEIVMTTNLLEWNHMLLS